jgi:hypothetical protein
VSGSGLGRSSNMALMTSSSFVLGVSRESHEFQHETLTKESISQVPPDGVHEVYDSDSETNFEARDDFLLQHHEGSP